MDPKRFQRIYPLIAMVNVLILLSMKVNGYPVPKTFLSNAEAKGAVCLDGSPPVYHFSPGFGSGANNWLVHMEGGGWCSTPEECIDRRSNFRGSSRLMKDLSFSGILANKPKTNPDFYNWNKVKVRYCDGSSFTGDVETVDPEKKVYYRGARIWLAIMEELLAKGMKNAQNAMLSGCSAGGLASILHCDKFRDLLPASANVKCFSDAGYFIQAKDVSGADRIGDFFSSVVATHGSAKNLPSSCTSKFSPNQCFFPQYVVQQMRTPLFILNSAYDEWQVRNVLVPSASKAKGWTDCKVDISKCDSNQISTLQGFRSEFLSVLPTGSSFGKFIISCHAHCQSGTQATWLTDKSPSIGNTKIAKAVGDWFYGRRVVEDIDCPYPCNSSCSKVIEE
ncbi:pectin acetylesterase 7-like [Asparagus officinalis]|uniref:pectin acetylesterase 7-like n=1 Tax=Asparagus officinalis TaxID=4686 RepID=UPI00098E2A8E|nr:pectin acetylesterase 7-like [Asparagus officinalis]XP_020263716.1 pectin acetylesterase 7-like [Asparagus officinalis]